MTDHDDVPELPEPGGPLRVSPSQIKRWRQCPRLTAWQLCRPDVVVPRDTLPRANDLGSRCHAVAEAYLKDGIAPDEGETFRYWRRVTRVTEYSPDRYAPEIRLMAADGSMVLAWGPGLSMAPTKEGLALALQATPGGWLEEAVDARPGAIVVSGLHHLPRPRAVKVEETIHYQAASGQYKSRADYVDLAGDPPMVGDHKFVRDLGQALSDTPGSTNSYGDPNYLGDDPQFLIQTAGLMVLTGARAACGTWIYYQTKAKSGRFPTRKVALTVLREHVAHGMDSIERSAALIHEVYQRQIDPRSLPPVTKSCHAYGRPCDYVNHCNLTERERFYGMSTQNVDPRVEEILRDLHRGAVGPTVIGAPPLPGEDGPPDLPEIPADVALDGFAPDLPEIPDVPAARPPAVEHTPEGALVHGVPFKTWAAWTLEERDRHMATLQGPDPINPPEAPPNDGNRGPAAPPKRTDPIVVPPGGYAAMDRAELKALAVQRGVVDSSSRLGDKALREALAKADQEALKTGTGQIGDAPVTTYPTAEEIQAGAPASPVLAPMPAQAWGKDVVSEIRATLDDLNRVGDRLRRLIGAD